MHAQVLTAGHACHASSLCDVPNKDVAAPDMCELYAISAVENIEPTWCRILRLLGPALAMLRFAPVETAKAVHITVAGTASMMGKAMGSATKTISSATGESMHTIAKKTRTDKVSAPCAIGGNVCPVI
jgi:hypothetical protein